MQQLRSGKAPRTSNHRGAGKRTMQQARLRMAPKTSNHKGGKREANAAN